MIFRAKITMDGIIVSDLLKGYNDLHPVIQHYMLDPLDSAANNLARECYPNLHSILMIYWDIHKTEMITIFTDCYPEDDLPEWVVYDKFRVDMIKRMVDWLFTVLGDADWWIDDENPSATDINFSEAISFPLMAEPMCYEIASRSTSQLGINMTVDLRVILEALGKIDSEDAKI